MKIQVLPNLIKDIRQFSPAIRYLTEVFECYNTIFHLCLVLSNHLAPSHDVVNKFLSMEHLKHILSSGYWKEDGEWIQAGSKVK